MFDKKKFFNAVRRLFGKLNQKQVEGIEAILDHWINSPLNDIRWLAYILATAWHETGTRMEAVREGFKDTDKESIAHVAMLKAKGKIRRNYALPHENGNSYYGRGLVQLTHGYNYTTMGEEIGIDLYSNPDEALKLDIAVRILIIGMVKGLFTGKRLADYFNNIDTNWINARRIVNGSDRASQIAKYAKDFYLALKQQGDLFNKIMEKEVEDEDSKSEKSKVKSEKQETKKESKKDSEKASKDKSKEETKKSKAVDPKKDKDKTKGDGKAAGKAGADPVKPEQENELGGTTGSGEGDSGDSDKAGSQDGNGEGSSESNSGDNSGDVDESTENKTE